VAWAEDVGREVRINRYREPSQGPASAFASPAPPTLLGCEVGHNAKGHVAAAVALLCAGVDAHRMRVFIADIYVLQTLRPAESSFPRSQAPPYHLTMTLYLDLDRLRRTRIKQRTFRVASLPLST
jgi:hypothetical protein